MTTRERPAPDADPPARDVLGDVPQPTPDAPRRTASATSARPRQHDLGIFLILHRVEEDEVRALPRLAKASNEPPFLRGTGLVGTGQASGLIPSAGASPLRDSAGLSPASLRSMPPQPELRQRYRTASCSCRWRLRAQPGRLMSLEPQSPSSSASPCSIRFRSPAPWPGSRAWSLPVPGAQRTGGRAGQRLAARVERAPLGPTATNAAPRRPR